MTCPEYEIRRISKADQIAFRDRWYKTAEKMHEFPVKWQVINIYFGFPSHGDRGRTITAFPHSLYVAYEKETGLPIARLAVDGRPWADVGIGAQMHYKYAYIDGLFVSKEFQGCGIGSHLMRVAENDYRSHKLHKGIYLHCYMQDRRDRFSGELIEKNVAPFYQKLGYMICDRADSNAKVGRYHFYNHGVDYFKNRGFAVMYKLF